LYYNGYLEFEGAVQYLLGHPEEVKQLHENARKYVHANYMWDVITDKLHRMIEAISGPDPTNK
jgi:spore maturation protein CgeB